MLINYLDNASATKVDLRVLQAMLPYLYQIY
jgi:cysteine sulfinate desulfinase/cysteine desulfurase-like protein